MSLESKIESLLFISGRPMSIRELAELTKSEIKKVEEACAEIMSKHKEAGSGTQIIKNASSYQLVTSPDNASLIKEFVKDETTGELSRPSLETLTIIAYRGPVSKTDLNRIRGVNCSLILHNLSIRGLIEAREDKKKMETYYTVSFDFLRFLGLNEIKELPDFERLSQDDTIDRLLSADGEKEINKPAVAETVFGAEETEEDDDDNEAEIEEEEDEDEVSDEDEE